MKDGGCAFPVPCMPDEGYATGMSLRDWFAGMAMQSLDPKRVVATSQEHDITALEAMAGIAYDMADAMLAERDKSNG